LQAAGSLEGKARARIHGGNAADDGAGQSGDEGPIGFGKFRAFTQLRPAALAA